MAVASIQTLPTLDARLNRSDASGEAGARNEKEKTCHAVVREKVRLA
jgi:hypothetical protein